MRWDGEREKRIEEVGTLYTTDIPTSFSDLFEERALLLSRLGRHEVPYSGFISQEKISANFADLSQFVKILFANIACARRASKRSLGGVANKMAIRENFIREIHKYQAFAKIFSREINPLYGSSCHLRSCSEGT